MIAVRPTFLGVAIGLLAPAAAWAQPLAGGHSPEVSIVRVLAALVVALSCAAGLALLARRAGSSGQGKWRAIGAAARLLPPKRIEAIETRRISASADVCLFRCDQWEYLIVTGAAGVEVLSRSRAPERSGGEAQ